MFGWFLLTVYVPWSSLRSFGIVGGIRFRCCTCILHFVTVIPWFTSCVGMFLCILYICISVLVRKLCGKWPLSAKGWPKKEQNNHWYQRILVSMTYKMRPQWNKKKLTFLFVNQNLWKQSKNSFDKDHACFKSRFQSLLEI